MTENNASQEWAISDELWDEIKDCIPNRQRDPQRVYKCKPGRGRKPLDKRRVMEGILYVLRNKCIWKAVPKEYGAASSVHLYYHEWLKAGVFEHIWKTGLMMRDELEGIGWEWKSEDGCKVKAPLSLESAWGPIMDKRKKWEKEKLS